MLDSDVVASQNMKIVPSVPFSLLFTLSSLMHHYLSIHCSVGPLTHFVFRVESKPLKPKPYKQSRASCIVANIHVLIAFIALITRLPRFIPCLVSVTLERTCWNPTLLEFCRYLVLERGLLRYQVDMPCLAFCLGWSKWFRRNRALKI